MHAYVCRVSGTTCCLPPVTGVLKGRAFVALLDLSCLWWKKGYADHHGVILDCLPSFRFFRPIALYPLLPPFFVPLAPSQK